jgi:hypothetical protein
MYSKKPPGSGGFSCQRLVSVGTGVLVVMLFVPLPGTVFPNVPVSLFIPVSLSVMSFPIPASGTGVRLKSAVGVGMTGVVTSGQGEAVTLPRPVVSPQADSSRLSSKASTRYAKDLFISILLLVFAQILFPPKAWFIHEECVLVAIIAEM